MSPNFGLSKLKIGMHRWTTLRRGVTLPEVTANADGLVSQTTHFPEPAKYDSAWKDAVDKAKLGTPAPRANLY